MPTVRWNRYWERYDWRADGEEWDGQARACGQPYEEWKRSLVESFAGDERVLGRRVLEIAPGHGRWTATLVERARELWLVDLNASCIEHCRRRFARATHVHYVVGDGRSLPGVPEASIDLAWSYDSFVHMEAGTVAAYLRELARVLAPGGIAVLHHPGRRHATLALGFLRRLGPPGRELYRRVSMPLDTGGGRDGDRGNLSARSFARLAGAAGLRVLRQTDRWGPDGRYDCRRFGDVVTELERPVP